MPRKDPVTGCMVMTTAEFLNAEAEREGKGRTGADIYADMMSEIDTDSRRCEDEIRKDALGRFQQAIKDAGEYWDDDEGNEPLPTLAEVVHIIDVHVSQGFKGSGEMLRAEVRTTDGRLLYMEYMYSHWSGTRLDPPEDDMEFNFGEFRPMSEHPWKCYQCGRVREKGARNWTHVKQSDDPKRAVHACPRCNGYEREKNKHRLERMRARNRKARAR
jgi:hypothetical protein